MPATHSKKIIIATGVVFLLSVTAYTTIYLPFYSNMLVKEVDKKSISQAGGGTRGSMWSNMDKYNSGKE